MFHEIMWLFVAQAVVNCAPPSPPTASRLFPQPFQNLVPLDYYSDNPEAGAYYGQQRQGEPNQGSTGRLETLEPDSEVELLPGAQPPHQPPQQTPVSPNVPNLVPGQRVFIVHMPVSGYRPGGVGGYQPLYIVAAAPQSNTAYTANGIHNAILLDPSGQAVVPAVGYPRPAAQPGLAPGQLLSSYGLRPLDYSYVYPDRAYLYHQPIFNQQGLGGQSPFRLAQFLGLQTAREAGNSQRATNSGGDKNQEARKERSSGETNDARPSRPHSRTKH